MSMEIVNWQDPVGPLITYQEFSNTFYGRNDSDWRVPTRDQMVDAFSAGLADYPDVSPYEGVQTYAEIHPYSLKWSSTKQGNRAWIVDVYTAETLDVRTGSVVVGGVIVRGGAAPPPSGGGKGKGNGNGNGKKNK